jgi:hypothetical protein
MSNLQKELDLEAIEATLAKLPRVPRFPAYFNDMRALVNEVKRLREEVEELNQALHVAPVKAQLAIANHIFMMDAALCLEVIAPEAHKELMKVGQQILEGVGQYNVQDQLQEENKRLRARVDELEKCLLAQMANESQLMGLYEDFDSGEER